MLPPYFCHYELRGSLIAQNSDNSWNFRDICTEIPICCSNRNNSRTHFFIASPLTLLLHPAPLTVKDLWTEHASGSYEHTISFYQWFNVSFEYDVNCYCSYASLRATSYRFIQYRLIILMIMSKGLFVRESDLSFRNYFQKSILVAWRTVTKKASEGRGSGVIYERSRGHNLKMTKTRDIISNLPISTVAWVKGCICKNVSFKNVEQTKNPRSFIKC